MNYFHPGIFFGIRVCLTIFDNVYFDDTGLNFYSDPFFLLVIVKGVYLIRFFIA